MFFADTKHLKMISTTKYINDLKILLNINRYLNVLLVKIIFCTVINIVDQDVIGMVFIQIFKMLIVPRNEYFSMFACIA